MDGLQSGEALLEARIGRPMRRGAPLRGFVSGSTGAKRDETSRCGRDTSTGRAANNNCANADWSDGHRRLPQRSLLLRRRVDRQRLRQ